MFMQLESISEWVGLKYIECFRYDYHTRFATIIACIAIMERERESDRKIAFYCPLYNVFKMNDANIMCINMLCESDTEINLSVLFF